MFNFKQYIFCICIFCLSTCANYEDDVEKDGLLPLDDPDFLKDFSSIFADYDKKPHINPIDFLKTKNKSKNRFFTFKIGPIGFNSNLGKPYRAISSFWNNTILGSREKSSEPKLTYSEYYKGKTINKMYGRNLEDIGEVEVEVEVDEDPVANSVYYNKFNFRQKLSSLSFHLNPIWNFHIKNSHWFWNIGIWGEKTHYSFGYNFLLSEIQKDEENPPIIEKKELISPLDPNEVITLNKWNISNLLSKKENLIENNESLPKDDQTKNGVFRMNINEYKYPLETVFVSEDELTNVLKEEDFNNFKKSNVKEEFWNEINNKKILNEKINKDIVDENYFASNTKYVPIMKISKCHPVIVNEGDKNEVKYQKGIEMRFFHKGYYPQENPVENQNNEQVLKQQLEKLEEVKRELEIVESGNNEIFKNDCNVIYFGSLEKKKYEEEKKDEKVKKNEEENKIEDNLSEEHQNSLEYKQGQDVDTVLNFTILRIGPSFGFTYYSNKINPWLGWHFSFSISFGWQFGIGENCDFCFWKTSKLFSVKYNLNDSAKSINYETLSSDELRICPFYGLFQFSIGYNKFSFWIRIYTPLFWGIKEKSYSLDIITNDINNEDEKRIYYPMYKDTGIKIKDNQSKVNLGGWGALSGWNIAFGIEYSI